MLICWLILELMSRKIQAGFTQVIILLAIIAVGVTVYFLKPWNKLNLPFLSKTPDIGAKIYQRTQNPVSRLPQTNPFSKVNPFKGVYKNPFE